MKNRISNNLQEDMSQNEKENTCWGDFNFQMELADSKARFTLSNEEMQNAGVS